MSHAGTSILFTSITDLIAFLAGSYSSIPIVKSFCQWVTFAPLMRVTLTVVNIVLIAATV
jgi:hypothetical protein